ncbi:hypothetical protein DdX_18961 [Ditylenchus destructor]|uniref:Uncharacterized protein n=1 Tax=Ditylenchus destructor TaxID=166010 RepID=A0AAD4QUH8_9BILA|nr:hypothetical protein DdX_18961 [Ditylenchus destructor]
MVFNAKSHFIILAVIITICSKFNYVDAYISCEVHRSGSVKVSYPLIKVHLHDNISKLKQALESQGKLKPEETFEVRDPNTEEKENIKVRDNDDKLKQYIYNNTHIDVYINRSAD